MTTIVISFLFAWLFVKLEIFRPARGQLNCGIFGFSGKRPVDVTKLRWLAVENQVRGTDSTGVFGNHLFKEKGRAREVVLLPGFHAAVKGALTVQGHTRAASTGFSVTRDNAHPFQYGHEADEEGTEWKSNVVGAHNGFVLPELLRHHEESLGFKKYFSVDSQLIFAALAKHGDVNIISKIEGGMAISFQFLDKNPNRLYLYKREETRPLFLGEAADGLYYSSIDESLKFIGCRNTWQLLPNMLYTLEGGQIIDIYRIPDPIVKSLAANVTRGAWRQGVPAAQLNALPTNAGSQTRLLAPSSNGTGTKGSGFQRDFGFHGNRSGFSKSQTSAKMGEEYKSKNSIESKFNMLIKNISRELQELEVDPIEVTEKTSIEQTDLSSCFLAIQVVDASNNKGLVAWSVLADGDTDLAGITDANGITLIKIPVGKCSQQITFFAYSPVDEFGPFSFIFMPEATRVVEVILSIPFLKKGRKKETGTYVDTLPESTEGSCGLGQHACPTFPFGPEPAILHGTGAGANSNVLRESPSQISRGLERQTAAGIQIESSAIDEIAPESELELGLGPSFNEKVKNTIPRLNPLARAGVIAMALATDEHNRFKYLENTPLTIIDWSVKLPERQLWLSHYCDNFAGRVHASELILDSTRLIQRDRYCIKAWFPLWVYIEILLKTRADNYFRVGVSEEERKSAYPSSILKSLGWEKLKKNNKILRIINPLG